MYLKHKWGTRKCFAAFSETKWLRYAIHEFAKSARIFRSGGNYPRDGPLVGVVLPEHVPPDISKGGALFGFVQANTLP